MPVPTPMLQDKDTSKLVLSWEYKNGSFRYFSDIYEDVNPKNPYSVINEQLKQEIEGYEDKTLSLNFIPLIHPLFDECSYVKDIIDHMRACAVKIHCLGAGITPCQVKPELLKLLSDNGIPVIVHVDHDKTGFSMSEGMRFLRSQNSALDWCKLFARYNVIGVITHGACLNQDALTMISENKNLYCGIGPDIYMGSNPYRLAINQEELSEFGYLGVLKKYASPEKLLFDIDYNYNYSFGNDSDYLDWRLHQRVRSIWNGQEAQKILYQNAQKLFNLPTDTSQKKRGYV
jgi:predicted TIM-barrel fold metal-dependent hydrolase